MKKYKGLDRRKAPRKEVYIPIKLMAKDNLTITGYLLDISCYGTKVELMFKTIEDKKLMDEILSTHDIDIEIGEEDSKRHFNAPVKIKWETYKYGEGEKIYELGLQLKLSDAQKQKWKLFCNSL